MLNIALVLVLVGTMLSVLVSSAPLLDRSKYTCLPKKGATIHGIQYTGRSWKQHCKALKGSPPTAVTYDDLYITEELLHNNLPSFETPENGVICFGVDRFSPELSKPGCPAFCKKRSNMVIRNNPLTMRTTLDKTITTVESLNYEHKEKYKKNMLCIYNISMPCSSDQVNVHHSHVDIKDNDFVQVINTRTRQSHPKVTGSSWPIEQGTITSSQFLMVFWSDKDTSQGKGFKLQMECSMNTLGSGSEPLSPNLINN